MSGLLVELEPGQTPSELPEPPSLHGARLRRKVPLDGLTRELRTRLARTTRVLESRIERELRRSGILAQVEADARRRAEKGATGRGGAPLGPERELALERTFRFDDMEAVARLFADEEDAFRIELDSVLGDSYQELFNRGGKAARIELGASGSFKLTNTAIADALKARANLLAGDIAEDVFDRLKTVIADGFYLEGRGIPDVTRMLRDEFDWLSRVRAERIARTETLSVTEEAQHTVYKASGVHFKRWITTLDGKERDTHFEAHGQIRAIDEAFDVGQAQLQWPGDPDGPPEEIINCRCASQPIVTSDQVFSDADVWRGDVDPDEFAQDQGDIPDELTTGPSAPPPSDTVDLNFGDQPPPEEDGGDGGDGKRWVSTIDLVDGLRLDKRAIAWVENWIKADREYERDLAGRFATTGGGGAGVETAAREPSPLSSRPMSRRNREALAAIRAAVEARNARGGGPLVVPPTAETQAAEAAAAREAENPQPAPIMSQPAFAGLPEPVARQLALVEHVITENDYETAAIIDKDGNRIALFSQGNPTAVGFGSHEQDQIRGNYVTHNHPSGRSFSKADILLTAKNHGLEVRAAGNDGTIYRMSSTRGETWPGQARITKELNDAVFSVDVDVAFGKQAGILTVEQANQEWNHLAWERAAPKLGLTYVRDDSRRDPEKAAALPRIDGAALAAAGAAGRERIAAEHRAALERLERAARPQPSEAAQAAQAAHAAERERAAVERAVQAQPSGAEASRARAAARAAAAAELRRGAEAEAARSRAAAQPPATTEQRAAIDRFRRQYAAQIRAREG